MDTITRPTLERLGFKFSSSDDYTFGRRGYRQMVSWANANPERITIRNEINKFTGNISDVDTLNIVLKALEIWEKD